MTFYTDDFLEIQLKSETHLHETWFVKLVETLVIKDFDQMVAQMKSQYQSHCSSSSEEHEHFITIQTGVEIFQ